MTFATFLRAMRSGDGYCNMHTTRFPGGEIRGQIASIARWGRRRELAHDQAGRMRRPT